MNDALQGLRLFLAALLAALLACPWASVDSTELQERPVKREILALYDGAQERSADATRIHRFAELPLNYLGYILRYRDVRAGLPERGEVAHFAGVLTWFVGPLTDGDAYLAWAERAAREGPRLVVLGGEVVEIETRRQDTHRALAEAEGRLTQAEGALVRLSLDHAAELARSIATTEDEIADAH